MLMIRNTHSRVTAIKTVTCIWLFLPSVGSVLVVSKTVTLDILVGKELFLKINKCVPEFSHSPKKIFLILIDCALFFFTFLQSIYLYMQVIAQSLYSFSKLLKLNCRCFFNLILQKAIKNQSEWNTAKLFPYHTGYRINQQGSTLY